ncbi:MAG: hypothetical protein HY718_10885, partial [Planctomycetes bacterium]|nr:hypothetical protein [Planctomycetota bacterium]
MASSGKLRDGGGMFGRNQRARVAGACRLAVATVGLLWGPAAWAQKPLGIDVSLWQGTITPANWTQVYNSGRRFAFIKASQGTTVTDPRFYSNVANAPVAGLLVAPYHFADPLNERQPADGHTAVDEANYFVAVAGNYMTAGYLPPVLDLEYGSSMGKTALSNWANSFCNRVLALKG